MKFVILFILAFSSHAWAGVGRGDIIHCPESMDPFQGPRYRLRELQAMIDKGTLPQSIFWAAPTDEHEQVRFLRLTSELLPVHGQFYAYLNLLYIDFKVVAREHWSVRMPKFSSPMRQGEKSCTQLSIIVRPQVRLSTDPPILINQMFWETMDDAERATAILRFLLTEVADNLNLPAEDPINEIMYSIVTGSYRKMTASDGEAHFRRLGFGIDAIAKLFNELQRSKGN